MEQGQNPLEMIDSQYIGASGSGLEHHQYTYLCKRSHAGIKFSIN